MKYLIIFCLSREVYIPILNIRMLITKESHFFFLLLQSTAYINCTITVNKYVTENVDV